MIDVSKYKAKLESELASLEQELSDVGVKNPTNTADWVAVVSPVEETDGADENVLADRMEELEENKAILTDLENKYNDVKDALAKIEKGTYGVCEISGEEIEEDRLEANPSARTCKKHMK